jgi:hypothetical protein
VTRTRRRIVVVGMAVLLGAIGTAAVASDRGSVRTRLKGFEEVPAISTEGGGTFRAMVSSSEIRYTLTYGDLNGPVQQAHIHFGQRSVNGGIAVFLCSNLGNGPVGTQACPLDEGTVSGTIRPADVIGPAGQGIAPGEFGELLRAMRAGKTYVNVHTDPHPGGEIRGQLPGDHKDHDHDD